MAEGGLKGSRSAEGKSEVTLIKAREKLFKTFCIQVFASAIFLVPQA